MKGNTKRSRSGLKSFVNLSAKRQSEAAVMLIGVIPALTAFYIGRQGNRLNEISPLVTPSIIIVTAFCGYVGYRILRKYPENIMALRTYISDLARGKLPDSVVLLDTAESDDLQYIEKSFNTLVLEMQKEVARAKIQLRNELQLRETVEKQQSQLLQAAHDKTMVDSISVIYKRIGKPTDDLHKRLHALSDQYCGQTEIEECIACVHEISNTLEMIRSAREFQNNPSAIGVAS